LSLEQLLNDSELDRQEQPEGHPNALDDSLKLELVNESPLSRRKNWNSARSMTKPQFELSDDSKDSRKLDTGQGSDKESDISIDFAQLVLGEKEQLSRIVCGHRDKKTRSKPEQAISQPINDFAFLA